jgi:hypothetical protein
MTGDNNAQKPSENSYIPSMEVPRTNSPKTAEKKSGNDWLGLVYIIIGLFVLIATFQLYFVIQELIRIWISDQFVPVVSAVYYIIVIAGGVWLIRDYIRKQ